jgi:hypothetical protein
VISLLERKSALLMTDVYPLRPGLRRRARARPSARVVSDLVIVAYGCALGLLGALLHPSVMKVDAGGEIEAGPDLMIGGFVAAVFVLLCILIANIDLRALQDFGRSLRRLLACLGAALVSSLFSRGPRASPGPRPRARCCSGSCSAPPC